MKRLIEIGDCVERRWREQNYSDEVFSSLADSVLRELSPAAEFSPVEVIESLLLDNGLPSQNLLQNFAHTRILVGQYQRFRVELLFWMDATTLVHHHAFSGAFQVMAGSSVHSCFDFRESERVSSRFWLGDLILTSSEVIQAGDTRQILLDSAYIHSVFHLDRPSITLLLRSNDVTRAAAYAPHVAFITDEADIRMPQLRSTLSVLVQTDRQGLQRFVRRIMTEADIATVFHVLRFIHPYTATLPPRLAVADVHEFAELARPRFGERVDLLLESVYSETRLVDLANRRSDIRGPEHRFFLALLMNVPSRKEILRLVGEHHEGDPAATVQRWLRELTRRGQDGYLSLLDVELACDDDTATGPGEGVEALLQEMTALMLAGARGPALLDGLASRLSPGFFTDVRDGVPELEAVLRSGALHALFAD